MTILYIYEDCYLCGNNFLAATYPELVGYGVCKECQRHHADDLDGLDRLFQEMWRLAK